MWRWGDHWMIDVKVVQNQASSLPNRAEPRRAMILVIPTHAGIQSPAGAAAAATTSRSLPQPSRLPALPRKHDPRFRAG
jgi:hypothetical protein